MKALRGKIHFVISLIIAAAFCFSARAQEEPSFEFPADHPLITQAIKALDLEQYARSARLFVAAINESRTERWSLYYMAAGCFAMAGKREAAFHYLDGAIRRGFWYVDYLERHDKLLALHSYKRWPRSIALCRATRAKMNFDLRKELLDLASEDQKVRARVTGAQTPPDVLAEMARVDLKTRTRLREIIRHFGWPRISVVGFDGASAAWLITQHADADVEFQKLCLQLMRAASKDGEAAKENLAFLIDRVRVADGRPQLYGTQFRYQDGKSVMAPVANQANLDPRRKLMGLSSIDAYRKQMQKQ
jgi:hypothetical protein